MIKTIPLKKNFEFSRVYKKGKYFVGKYMTLYILPNRNKELNRLGISVSKKIGNSVKRNRLRRLIRENYRLYEIFVKSGFDIVYIGRETDILAQYVDIKKEMKFLLKKLNIYDKEKELV